MPFYKKDENEILVGDNFVHMPDMSLTVETKDNFIYPQNGWYWFDTFDEALSFFASVKDGNSITALQGLLAIDAAGLSSAYEAWANNTERTFVEKAFINKAQIWKRDDTTLLSATAMFGLTETQVDDLFILGATL